jgi:hypothetical protein
VKIEIVQIVIAVVGVLYLIGWYGRAIARNWQSIKFREIPMSADVDSSDGDEVS